MKFDITKIDKKKLLRALYEYSYPIEQELDTLSDLECEYGLVEFKEMKGNGSARIFDCHNGRAMKLVFDKTNNGRITVDASRYDACNGKYKFLEAMLNTFKRNKILIIRKTYSPYIMKELPEYLVKSKEEDAKFSLLLKSCVKGEDEFGKHWILPTSK